MALNEQLLPLGVQKENDPLSMSNSENPNAQITQTLFDGNNFATWSRQLQRALGAKMKLGFLTRTVTRPDEKSADLARWIRCDEMVACWILNSMALDVSNSFILVSSAKELWQEILERYSHSNAPILYQLKQELVQVVQGSMTVTSYYTKMKRYYDELQLMNAIPQCSCGFMAKCTYKIMLRVPKKILELMNVPGLTRENVGSHLQKYRLCLRKLTGESLQFGGMNNFFMGPPNSTFGTMASLGGIDLQTLTGYQPTLPSISMPVHQTNALGYQTTNSLSELQQLSNTNNHSAYLPHGMTSFYQSAPLWSNGALVGALPRNDLADNDLRMAYTSLPQPSHMVDLSVNHVSDFRSSFKEGVSLDKKLSREFDPTYDTFNDLSQQTPQDWQPGRLSSVGIQNNSFLENITASTLEHHQGGNIKNDNNLVADNISSTVMSVETVQEASSASNHYNFEFDQDDLFSVMLSQQKEEIRPIDDEFKFDGYTLEDLL